LLLSDGLIIKFAHPSFKWSNLASERAGVTVAIVGIGKISSDPRFIYYSERRKEVDNISPYLVEGPAQVVESRQEPLANLPFMTFGSMPNDGGNLLLTATEADIALERGEADFIRPILGSEEFINGVERRCIWVSADDFERAAEFPFLARRFAAVSAARARSRRAATAQLSKVPYRFGEVRQRGNERAIIVPRVSSEERPYLPVGLVPSGTIVSDRNFALYDAPLWNLSLIASRLHWVWIGTVCVRLRMDFSYSNTLGWNTFPLPPLTEKNKADLIRCAEDILLAREAHFPATIAEMYDPERMDCDFPDLRAAHERNDEVLERIYIGRRFRNDTERLEKLFDLHTKMTAAAPATFGADKRSQTRVNRSNEAMDEDTART
jgi:hypothetical protein